MSFQIEFGLIRSPSSALVRCTPTAEHGHVETHVVTDGDQQMPRKPDPAKEAQQSRTQRWRKRMREHAAPETDAVDAALAAALAVYAEAARTAGKSLRRIAALEAMAVSYLVSRGYAPEHARQRVGRRVHRLDVADLVPLVVGSMSSPGDTEN